MFLRVEIDVRPHSGVLLARRTPAVQAAANCYLIGFGRMLQNDFRYFTDRRKN